MNARHLSSRSPACSRRLLGTQRLQTRARTLPSVALLTLLTSCATQLPTPTVDATPRVPPLPQEARQPPANPICDPTCFERLIADYELWLKKLTDAAPPAQPASAPTTP